MKTHVMSHNFLFFLKCAKCFPIKQGTRNCFSTSHSVVASVDILNNKVSLTFFSQRFLKKYLAVITYKRVFPLYSHNAASNHLFSSQNFFICFECVPTSCCKRKMMHISRIIVCYNNNCTRSLISWVISLCWRYNVSSSKE